MEDQQLQTLFNRYIDHIYAYVEHDQVRVPPPEGFPPGPYYVEPDETFMLEIEEGADISEQGSDEFRRDIVAFLGNLAIGNKFALHWDFNPFLAFAMRCYLATTDWNCADFRVANGQNVHFMALTCLEDPALVPILADALEDAGCHDEAILGHLRTDPVPRHKCRVVQMLAKE